MIKTITLLLISTIMMSCGQASNLWPSQQLKAKSVEPATSEEFSYHFSGQSCSTGEQAAATFSEICETLKDDELNDACAQGKREELFLNAECSGSFY